MSQAQPANQITVWRKGLENENADNMNQQFEVDPNDEQPTLGQFINQHLEFEGHRAIKITVPSDLTRRNDLTLWTAGFGFRGDASRPLWEQIIKIQGYAFLGQQHGQYSIIVDYRPVSNMIAQPARTITVYRAGLIGDNGRNMCDDLPMVVGVQLTVAEVVEQVLQCNGQTASRVMIGDEPMWTLSGGFTVDPTQPFWVQAVRLNHGVVYHGNTQGLYTFVAEYAQ